MRHIAERHLGDTFLQFARVCVVQQTDLAVVTTSLTGEQPHLVVLCVGVVDVTVYDDP